MKHAFIVGLALGSVMLSTGPVSGAQSDQDRSGVVWCDTHEASPQAFPFGGMSGGGVGAAIRACLDAGGHPVGIQFN